MLTMIDKNAWNTSHRVRKSGLEALVMIWQYQLDYRTVLSMVNELHEV